MPRRLQISLVLKGLDHILNQEEFFLRDLRIFLKDNCVELFQYEPHLVPMGLDLGLVNELPPQSLDHLEDLAGLLHPNLTWRSCQFLTLNTLQRQGLEEHLITQL